MCKQINPFTSGGHPCLLQPDISVIELQFWVHEGSPPHKIQIEVSEEDKKKTFELLFSPHSLSIFIIFDSASELGSLGLIDQIQGSK